MTNYVCLSIVLLFFGCTKQGNKRQEDKYEEQRGSLRNYDSLMNNAIDNVINKKILNNSELLKLIPETSAEYINYYSCTSPTKGENVNDAFIIIDDNIKANATQNVQGFLIKYLELSQFVDGEYAESYFEDIDFIIEGNKNIFCTTYNNLTDISKSKLEDYYNQYCK